MTSLLKFVLAVLSTVTLACRKSAPSLRTTNSEQADSVTGWLADVPQLPGFADYPVSGAFRGRPAPARFENDSLDRRFRTVLREGAQRGPNFAGHFTIVTWGCGSSCQMNAVIDAHAGRIYHPWFQTMMGSAHELSSALLIADPPDSTIAAFGAEIVRGPCVSCGTPAAYVWRSDHLEPVGQYDHPHLLSR